MSRIKFRQVFVYLGLSVSLVFVSASISQADPYSFNVTAEVGCDPGNPAEDIAGTLNNVTVADGYFLDLGEVSQGDNVFIDFVVDADDPTDCEGFSLGPDPIDISYSDSSIFSDMGCDTSDSVCGVDVLIPNVTGTLNETITFSHTP